MSEDHVYGVDRVGAERLVQVQRFGNAAPGQDFVQQVPADQRHEPEADLKRAVLPTFARQGDVQIHLRRTRGDQFAFRGEPGRHRIWARLTPAAATGSGLTVYRLLFPS